MPSLNNARALAERVVTCISVVGCARHNDATENDKNRIRETLRNIPVNSPWLELPLHGPFTALWSRFGARRAAFAKWNDHHCLLNQRFVIPGQLLRNAFHGLFITGLLVGLE